LHTGADPCPVLRGTIFKSSLATLLRQGEQRELQDHFRIYDTVRRHGQNHPVLYLSDMTALWNGQTRLRDLGQPLVIL
jgi:hypothetical protein